MSDALERLAVLVRRQSASHAHKLVAAYGLDQIGEQRPARVMMQILKTPVRPELPHVNGTKDLVLGEDFLPFLAKPEEPLPSRSKPATTAIGRLLSVPLSSM